MNQLLHEEKTKSLRSISPFWNICNRISLTSKNQTVLGVAVANGHVPVIGFLSTRPELDANKTADDVGEGGNFNYCCFSKYGESITDQHTILILNQ